VFQVIRSELARMFPPLESHEDAAVGRDPLRLVDMSQRPTRQLLTAAIRLLLSKARDRDS
jgi:hypothetical protein